MKRRVILLADDDVVLRNLIRQSLEKSGFEVIPAAHGAEALEQSRNYTEHIDVLITDLDMPEMNGIALVEHVRRERPDTRILIISGGSDLASVEKLACSFMPKPFLPESLIRQVDALISCTHDPSGRKQM